MFKYGFNWPYDYFSLVELIKVDANIGFNQVEEQGQELIRAANVARAEAGQAPIEDVQLIE